VVKKSRRAFLRVSIRSLISSIVSSFIAEVPSVFRDGQPCVSYCYDFCL